MGPIAPDDGVAASVRGSGGAGNKAKRSVDTSNETVSVIKSSNSNLLREGISFLWLEALWDQIRRNFVILLSARFCW